MKDWFLFSILALVFWGLWAFFPRFAVEYIQPRSLLLYQVVGIVLAFGILFAIGSGKVETHPVGILIGVLSGACGIVGSYFFNMAMQKGNATAVLAVTALYPVVAMVLVFLFFREVITGRQALGVISALAAVLLLAH